MSNKSSFKETFTLMWKLGVICIVVAGLLAWINSMTAPVIEKNEKTTFEQSMTEVLTGVNEFEEVDISYAPSEAGVKLDSFYKAGDKGYVVTTVCSEGYGGDIKVMVGVNADKTINKIRIMSLSETAGLGAKANTEEFMGQYSGLKSGIGIEKNNGGNPDNNTISAISGATITSKAVTKAVNCALQAVEEGGAE